MHQRQVAQIETVHCLGWTSQQLDAYIRQMLATFERSDSVAMESFSTVVERPVDCCPIRPCPLLV
ncbi:hypothetical protein [Synechococcus sp. PCC 7336]|uniref:hypothetical protein n=1 Tax=Synechococcus sp. PCC 7336 TaxID=195250 RepID=UPI00034896C7|nr:hypothetical protein [Synechococcus sp. PCC 7336]